MNRQMQETVVGDIDLQKMRDYINYCKSCVTFPLMITNCNSHETYNLYRSLVNVPQDWPLKQLENWVATSLLSERKWSKQKRTLRSGHPSQLLSGNSPSTCIEVPIGQVIHMLHLDNWKLSFVSQNPWQRWHYRLLLLKNMLMKRYDCSSSQPWMPCKVEEVRYHCLEQHCYT